MIYECNVNLNEHPSYTIEYLYKKFPDVFPDTLYNKFSNLVIIIWQTSIPLIKAQNIEMLTINCYFDERNTSVYENIRNQESIIENIKKIANQNVDDHLMFFVYVRQSSDIILCFFMTVEFDSIYLKSAIHIKSLYIKSLNLQSSKSAANSLEPSAS